MNDLEHIISLIRAFHYTTDLPVWIFQKKKAVFKLPETLTTAEMIVKGSFSTPFITDDIHSAQIIQSEYKETAIIITLSQHHCTVAVGPFLSEPIESGTITNLIRDEVIPFHQKSNITNYYHGLSILSEKKIYYISKMLNNLFLNNSNKIATKEKELDHQVHDSYFKQKNEYRKNVFLHSPYAIEQEVSKSISIGNVENAKRLLNEINLEPHAKLAPTMLRSYKNSMICSCAFMTRAAIAGGVNPNEAFTLSDTLINQIEDFELVDELQPFESKMVEAFSELVNNTKSKIYSNSVLNVIYYIDNHLCEDLNINILAKEVYLNPSYLSNLFHKETGITITDWIVEKRIKEAAHFILNSNETFSNIAFFYHFSSQSYFVQCFKKIIGVTPGEYRRKGKK